jgi:RNase P subunit RPR2
LAPPAEKRMLEENEKDIKKKVEKLYELATELKAEVDKTDSSKVLSLNLIRKAEEIEKLAHDIKNRSKG